MSLIVRIPCSVTRKPPTNEHAAGFCGIIEEPRGFPDDEAAMAETSKCPNCAAEIALDARKCGKCRYDLKSELECLRSIDVAVGVIKRILIWFVFVTFMGAVVYFVFHLRRG